MSMDYSYYIGFVDSAWVIYTPTGHVFYSRGICLQPSSNNVVEYSVVIGLLRDSISYGVLSLEVRLDSELVVSQLNGLY